MEQNLSQATPKPDDAAIQRSHTDADSTLVLIEDRALICGCLVDWLEEHDLHVRSVSSTQDFIASFPFNNQANLILLSIGDARVTSPDVRGSIDRLTQDFADVPLVLLADRENIKDVGDAIRRGARGYIPTSLDLIEAAAALRFVLAGGTYVPAASLVQTTPDRARDGSSTA